MNRLTLFLTLLFLSLPLSISIAQTTTEQLADETIEQVGPTLPVQAPVQESFQIVQLDEHVFAAIARPGSQATTNALFVIGKEYVVAAGAHMSKAVIDDLYLAITEQTEKPVRFFVLTHHHKGYTYIDFDFPPRQDIVMSWQTWQDLSEEIRKPEYPVFFFNEGLTLKPGDVTIILTNIGKGHTDGDLIVYVPEADVVFASDLLYVNSVGYMASGHMTEWLMALDFLTQLGAERIIPGYGPVSTEEDIYAFSMFFRDFLTSVFRHIEQGDPLDKVLAEFDMPEYHQLDGYEMLIQANLKRAYEDLAETFRE